MNISIHSLLPILVGLPLIAAVTSVLISNRHARAWTSIVIAIFQLVITVLILLWLPESSETQRHALGGWGQPLGIDLYVDGFTALMLALTAALGLVLGIYSSFYFAEPQKAARFWPLWWLLITGLNALFLSGDIFNIYVTLEVIGLAAVALVALQGSRAALTASLRYLLVSLLGSLCYLLGVALLYREYGTLDLVMLSSVAAPTALSSAALVSMTAGLLLKTALFPLHFWLPLAHGSAPAPVSAVLSALVVKASFYLLARFWLDTLAPVATDLGLYIFGALGVMAIVWGSVQAFRAKRLKLMVAYSTVAQLGYLFLLFPLSSNVSVDGLSGSAMNAVAYLIVAHACAKAAMFLAVGNIMRVVGHDDIDRLKGLASTMPLSIFTFAIAGASLIGLPPSAGFVAKWLLLTAAISSGQWWWVIVILAGGLMAALYVFRILNLAFVDEKPCIVSKSTAPTSANAIPVIMPLCGFALATMTIFLGFNAQWLLDLTSHATHDLSLGNIGASR